MRRAIGLGVWAVAALAQIQHESPAVTGKGALQGTVTDSLSHEPLKKAQVTISGSVEAPLTAITDAGGRFAFRDLAPGNYWLNASKAGFDPPNSLFGSGASIGIALGEGEGRKDIAIALTRGGSISGRVTNEEGAGIRGCGVMAVLRGSGRRFDRRIAMGGAPTGDKGNYIIRDLAQGRYYLFVSCHILLPAPHPLLRRDDPRTPHETYLPQFYGGASGGQSDASNATTLALAAAASREDIDFQMTRVPALTLRGVVSASDPDAFTGGVNLLLAPASPQMQSLLHLSGVATAQNHAFEIQPVVPGSYVLYAFNQREGRLFAAQRSVEVGTSPPLPLEIAMADTMDLKGSVVLDDDDHTVPEGVGQVALLSHDRPFAVPQPRGEIGKNGAFTLTGVVPGHWRLNLNAPNYVKSVSLGGQPVVSPFDFEIAEGTAGPLLIVLGTRMASVTVHIQGPADHQVSALLYPDGPQRMDAGLDRLGSASGGEQVQFGGLAPGRYRVLATDAQNPWLLVQRPDVLQALEKHTAVIEVQEGGQASTTVEVISREELMRAFDELE